MQRPEKKPVALVVEDNEHIAYLLEHMLHREGFAVCCLPDGQKAAEHIADSDAADIAILDLMLPRLNGFEILELIRAHPRWAEVPVIILSARSQEDDIVRALEAGANDYVRKPYQPKELMARIRLRLAEANEVQAF